MNKPSGVYIPQIDGKDLWLTNYAKPNNIGYSLLDKNGSVNTKRYKAVFDYSLDLIKLRDVYKRAYRNNRFSYIEKENDITKEYCNRIINVTFKYSVKLWNRCGKDIYIKLGYDQTGIKWRDCVGYVGTEIAAVKVGDTVETPVDIGKGITYNQEKCVYEANPNMACVESVDSIRSKLYTDGFYCDGIHYVRWKRSSGSARVGKCLFIDEKLYSRMHTWEMCGLKVGNGDTVDLAALQSYISLTSSSIIGTVQIRPENILLIDDYNSVFTDKCINVTEENGSLKAEHDNVEISNSIWDGQSLIDSSLMGEYSDKGMILLRNRFFKSCAFNCNIQRWFRDNNITSVSQLNGKTRARSIDEVLLITTPSSIKYMKFAELDQWLDILEPDFGVVKYEKPTHYLGGKLVQTHYQLLNSIQLTKEDIDNLLEPTFNFLDLCRSNPTVLKHWIKYKPQFAEPEPLLTKNDIVYKLLSTNNRFFKTKLYADFKDEFIKSFIQNAKCGHIFVNGNYSVLCGNPIEMLMQSVGTFFGKRVVGKDCVFSKRFEWGQVLLGSRSPHITASNVLLTLNQYNEHIDRYMNATREIVYVNSIGENLLQRLAGADFDSDTILLTDNQVLINAAKRTAKLFDVAVCNVSGAKRKRTYTTNDMADLDVKTSKNLIGEIINVSQYCNTLIWDKLAKGGTFKDIDDIYLDVCKLSVLSNMEIDLLVSAYRNVRKN